MQCGMSKLRVNKACPSDISSVVPARDSSRPGYRGNMPKFEPSLNRSGGLETSFRMSQPLTQSQIYSAPQSQQSFWQGLTQSQYTQQFSQTSQEDPSMIYEPWRCSREATNRRPLERTSLQPSLSRFPSRENSSRLPIASASTTKNNLLEKIKSSTWPEPNCYGSQGLDQRFDSLNDGLNRVVSVLDCVQCDLKQLVAAVKEASVESEGIKQKLMIQESYIETLMKEEERIKETIMQVLKNLERKAEDAQTLKLGGLAQDLKRMPASMKKHFSVISKELCSFIKSQLQMVSENLRTREEAWFIHMLQKTATIAQYQAAAMLENRFTKEETSKQFGEPQKALLLKDAKYEDSEEIQKSGKVYHRRGNAGRAPLDRSRSVKVESATNEDAIQKNMKAHDTYTAKARAQRHNLVKNEALAFQAVKATKREYETRAQSCKRAPLHPHTKPVKIEEDGWIEKKSSWSKQQQPRGRSTIATRKEPDLATLSPSFKGKQNLTPSYKNQNVVVVRAINETEEEDPFLFFDMVEEKGAANYIEDPFDGLQSENEARRIQEKMMRARMKKMRSK